MVQEWRGGNGWLRSEDYRKGRGMDGYGGFRSKDQDGEVEKMVQE
jgi:hypothetical protein